jgi:Ca-activated chloride channel family protein
MYKIIFFLIAISNVFQINAQDKQEDPSPILFIYDASGSMWGKMQAKTKKEIASIVLSTSVNNLPNNQNVGLIAYGHRKKGDCNDIEFLVDLKNNSKDKVTQAVKGINPLGRTPLARSATMAINYLRNSETKATIILITDGIESCDGNICDVVSTAKAEGIDFKLHIVGFGLKEGEAKQLKCAAEAGGGHYYAATDAGGLGEVLNEATTTTIDKPDGNVSVYTVKNGIPIDALVKAYDIKGKRKPISVRTYQDTAYFYLPPSTYNFEVSPLENSDVDIKTVANIESFEDKIVHKTISFDGGKLDVTVTNNNEGWDAVVKMYEKGTKKVVANTRTYGRNQTMEVNPGTYDVIFQALTMKGLETFYTLENVEVKAGENSSVKHNFKTGIAMIGVKSGNELVDATVNFTEVKTKTWIAGSRTYTSENNNPKMFLLNPGTYSVKIMTLGKHKGKTETFTITVKAGETVERIITY